MSALEFGNDSVVTAVVTTDDLHAITLGPFDWFRECTRAHCHYVAILIARLGAVTVAEEKGYPSVLS